MLDGINVLNTIELTKMVSNPIWDYVCNVSLIICVIGIVLMGSCLIGNENDIIGTIGLLMTMGFILLALISALISKNTEKEVPTGEYEYQVTIDESVSMVDFTSKYDIIRVDGEIYTIREKDGE